MNKILTTITTLGVATLGGVAVATTINTEEQQPINDIIIQEEVVTPVQETGQEEEKQITELKEITKEEIEMPAVQYIPAPVEENKTCLMFEQYGTTDMWEAFKQDDPRTAEYYESIGVYDLEYAVKYAHSMFANYTNQATKYYAKYTNLSADCE